MAKRKRSQPSFQGLRLANKFTHRYGPDMLTGVGPLIPATWQAPTALRAALAREGRTVPPPFGGALLLDTGASRTCIGGEAAAALALEAASMGATYGAGGKTQNPIVIAELVISIADGAVRRNLTFQLPAMVIPEMDSSRGATVLQYGDRPIPLIGLLGRDILRHTTFHYNGPEGKLALTFSRDFIHDVDRHSLQATQA